MRLFSDLWIRTIFAREAERRTRIGAPKQDMRGIAGWALGSAATFFAIVAVLLNAPVLFYMGTGLIATIAASRFQAWLSVRGLRFDRVAPNQVRVGDLVTVQISVWSERKVKRPLVTVTDSLPPRLPVADRSPSLPIAPAFDVPRDVDVWIAERTRLSIGHSFDGYIRVSRRLAAFPVVLS